MLSDREAEEIERGRQQRVGGPIILKWLDQLLLDRRERIQQLEHLRRRLNQAFRYLDGLVRDVQRGPSSKPAGRPNATPTAGPAPSRPPTRPVCPACAQPYVQAHGRSPNGIAYMHDDGRECRA